MPISIESSFALADGTRVPWLAWGNGSGKARLTALESGKVALAAGIRHIDTAQAYKTEGATADAIAAAGIAREDVYITSKLSQDGGQPLALAAVRPAIDETLRKLGTTPDLFLIHNPFVAAPGALPALWRLLEDLHLAGTLRAIGVSNFRPQDLRAVLAGARVAPAVHQLEYHPFVLAHLAPVLALHAAHAIRTAAYGPLTPLLRAPARGGALAPVLARVAARVSAAGHAVDAAGVLLLWTRARGVIAVTASGDAGRIRGLAAVAALPDGLLTDEEVAEITAFGEKVHFRHYREHMEEDFPLPDLPSSI